MIVVRSPAMSLDALVISSAGSPKFLITSVLNASSPASGGAGSVIDGGVTANNGRTNPVTGRNARGWRGWLVRTIA